MTYHTGCTIANGCNGSWAGLWGSLAFWGFVGFVALILWLVLRE